MTLEKAIQIINSDDFAVYNGLYVLCSIMTTPFQTKTVKKHIDTFQPLEAIKKEIEKMPFVTGVYLAVNIGAEDRPVTI